VSKIINHKESKYYPRYNLRLYVKQAESSMNKAFYKQSYIQKKPANIISKLPNIYNLSINC